jgi:uncharacterized membrane protein YkvA (DUF1232 family)
MAIALASRMVGRPARLVILVARLFVRLDGSTFQELSFSAARERLQQLGRLTMAYARGEYRRIPVKSIVIITAALLYFLNPLDVIPDVVPALGLTDDIAVLAWLYQNLSGELAAFHRWEQAAVNS